jgi:hypothetical protein
MTKVFATSDSHCEPNLFAYECQRNLVGSVCLIVCQALNPGGKEPAPHATVFGFQICIAFSKFVILRGTYPTFFASVGLNKIPNV